MPSCTLHAGSMAFEEGGERIDDLKLVLQRSAEITSKFDSDGILVRGALTLQHACLSGTCHCHSHLLRWLPSHASA